MNIPQRDLLVKTLADLAKGMVLGTVIAFGTDKMEFLFASVAIAGSVHIYMIAHELL